MRSPEGVGANPFDQVEVFKDGRLVETATTNLVKNIKNWVILKNIHIVTFTYILVFMSAKTTQVHWFSVDQQLISFNLDTANAHLLVDRIKVNSI